jgi:CMP-N-acetylneuraminic acid synthetase
MKAVIPAKACSSRVPNKNYRPFAGGDSLVSLLIQKLLRVLSPSDIYLSSESYAAEVLAARDGIQFLARAERLCRNETPLPHVVRGICRDIHGSDPILWCECIDPLFNQHGEVLDAWRERPNDSTADSLVVVHPERSYLLDGHHQPVGFGFGPWHIPSQQLPTHYRLNFTCSILTREAIATCGYMVGARPTWFNAATPFIDIDTEEDFRIAQIIYAERLKGATV